jgi:hypothetical protein
LELQQHIIAQVKNVQVQKTAPPVKIVSTVNTVLKMEELVGCVNDLKRPF